jgi:hypothetical protein
MAGCAGNEKLCSGVCVKIDDPNFGCSQTACDACAALPNGAAACAGNVCVLGDCNTGFKNCDGNDANGCEANIQTDITQCGACGSPCQVPFATAACVNGKCEVGACSMNRVDCDGDVTNGCESNTDVDPKNCGMCGKVCPTGESCEMGVCGLYCAKGKANCDNDEINGCETPLGTNADCAFCGDTCAPANAQASCDMNGVCTLDQCNMGFANCDMSSANGCEINTNTDAGNCGFCGNVCPSGPHSTAACVNGGCVLNCDPGYDNCDNNPSTGCEVHSDVDTANCGSCGHGCVIPNGAAACQGGMCLVATCNTGFANCDMNPANGCEVNTTSNPANCGGCGMGCTIPNGVAGCAGSMCTVGSCAQGYDDCDHQVANGCEVHTGVDTANCGTCGNVCNLANATQQCTNGTCTVGGCTPGHQNCDNLPADGCEVDTNNDPLNCGACNHQCFVANGVAGCSAGQCTVASCNSGFGDCNNLSQDGCETNLTNSLGNCGTCGNNCQTSCTTNVTGSTCNSGSCQITGCTANHFDIDQVCSDGCECTTAGTSSSCVSPSSLGTLQVGQTNTFSGNLVPSGQEAYLSITFAGNTNYSYHPHVVLTTGAAEFAFDALVTCGGSAISCGVEGGNSTNRTDWEEVYTGGDPNNPPNFNAIPPVGAGGTVIIHVYRRPGLPVSCNGYTLTLSN